MATKAVYEPSARFLHSAFSIDRRVYVRGGRTDDFESGSKDGKLELANSIEQFDPFLEVWCQLKTTVGTPHPGLSGGACVSFGENVYMYGGYSGRRYEGALSCLNVNWSLLCPEEVAGGPMRKTGCGILMFHGDKLAVIGGYGNSSGLAQSGSTFIRNTNFTDGSGWTNEFHVFNIGQGLWSSPMLRGTRLPPCAGFTLTAIDNSRAVLFAGHQPEHGIVNDLYIIDFDIMEITNVEPRDGEPWPPARSSGHAACCLGFAGDHINLLVTGGVG